MTEEKEEEAKEELLPTGDSSNVGHASSLPREDVEMQAPEEALEAKQEDSKLDTELKEKSCADLEEKIDP